MTELIRITEGNWLLRKKTIERACAEIKVETLKRKAEKANRIIKISNRITFLENALEKYKMYVFPTEKDKEIIRQYVAELEHKYYELGRLI